MSSYYDGVRHDSSWGEMPAAAYMAGTVADLRLLDAELRRAVVLIDAGEASWPGRLVVPAINQLADLDRPLRALLADLRDEEGRAVGVRQLAIAEETDVEVTRRRLLDAVHWLSADERGTICWQEGPRH